MAANKEYVQGIDTGSKESKTTVMYLCDRRKCERCGEKSMGLCRHTIDITYAKNFKNVCGKFIENDIEDEEIPEGKVAPAL